MASSAPSPPLGVATALVAALLACKKEAPPAPDPPPPPPAASAATRCGPGIDVDPGAGEFKPAVTAFKDKDYATTRRLLATMADKYPKSAKVRVWAGDAHLYEKSTDAAADASLPYYKRALELHAEGCPLDEVEHYYLLLGIANAYLRKRDAASAVPHLEDSVKRWPNSAQGFYVLARAQCGAGNVEGCLTSFEKALTVAKRAQRPAFLRTHYSLDDWIRMSARQSEFVKLRLNPGYAKAIREAKKDD
ncbi:MAG: hypothetical protein IT376_22720 [Polyangiaceae bacterium]|nr:hypothetical protein [Polyangiaceae bacterium]